MTDKEALDAFQELAKSEGIIPALESSHALAHALKMARSEPEKSRCLSSTSPVVATKISSPLPTSLKRRNLVMNRYAQLFSRLDEANQGAFVPFVMLGDPTPELSLAIVDALVEGAPMPSSSAFPSPIR